MNSEATPEEHELVERLSRGDDGAIEPLLTRHLPGLRAFVRARAGALVRGREDDADIVQSVCREVLTHRERFTVPAEQGFKRWLYLSALRKIQRRREHWLAQKRDIGREVAAEGSRSDADLLAGYATLCTPSRELMAREAIERIEQAVDALPDDYREALTLSRIVGLTRAEIADVMGKSEGSVRMLLSRAQARLVELLA
ncbi:MAG: sigma-70 family RNA polymerase sigma factor [Planctomycetota bacterium]